DWSSDVCSSDLEAARVKPIVARVARFKAEAPAGVQRRITVLQVQAVAIGIKAAQTPGEEMTIGGLSEIMQHAGRQARTHILGVQLVRDGKTDPGVQAQATGQVEPAVEDQVELRLVGIGIIVKPGGKIRVESKTETGGPDCAAVFSEEATGLTTQGR